MANDGSKPLKADVTVGHISIDGDGAGGMLIMVGDRDPWHVKERDAKLLMIALTAKLGHEAFGERD